MDKNIVVVDIDSTLHEYMHTVALVALNEFGIRLEDPPVDWNDALPKGLTRDEQIKIFQRCHDSEYIFLTNPYPHSKDALLAISDMGYQIWYVSDRKPEAESDTREWLRQHGFPDVGNVTCSVDKRGILSDNKDRILTVIDDRPRTLIFARYELGMDDVYSIKHTYNRNLTDIPGVHILDDWKDIETKFTEDRA